MYKRQEQEAVDAGILNLDGTLPIIKDPAAFEEKYGKISALIVNTADRVVQMCIRDRDWGCTAAFAT